MEQKRKVAMLFAYCGTNYGGFQISAGQRTLQAELELEIKTLEFLTSMVGPLRHGRTRAFTLVRKSFQSSWPLEIWTSMLFGVEY